MSRRRTTPLLALVTVLVVGLLAPASAPASAGDPTLAARVGKAPTTTKIRVVSHNVLKLDEAVDLAVTRAISSRAEVVALQEVCWDQARDLQAAHPDWTVAFKTDRQVHPDCPVVPRSLLEVLSGVPARRPSGLVVAWTGGADATSQEWVFREQLGDRVQGLLCLTWEVDGVRRHGCSTHLVAGQEPERRREVRLEQTRQLKRITAPWIEADELVVVAGDFNTWPNDVPMDQVYRFRGQGGFRETTAPPKAMKRDCRCVRRTFDRGHSKLDYIFYSANRMDGRAARGLRRIESPSDHLLLIGWAALDARAR